MVDTCQGKTSIHASFINLIIKKGYFFVLVLLTEAGSSSNDGWSLWYSRIGYRMTWFRRGAAHIYEREF